MAAGTKLVLAFNTDDGETAQFTYNYAKPGAGANNVKTLVNTMINNTAIFEKTLISIKSAKEVTTSETIYEIAETESKIVDMNPEHNAIDENTVVTEKTIG